MLIAGVLASLVAVAVRSLPLFYAATAIAGIGVGAMFSAFARVVAPLAPPHGRGALLAAVYVLTYASFSLPAIVGGIAASLLGLEATVYTYGLVVATLAGVTTVAVARRLQRVAVTTP